MRYELRRGSPMTGEGCIIVELDGTEPMGYYLGYLDVRRREWTLYPHKKAERHYAPLQKKQLPESAVKPAPPSAPQARKQSVKQKKGDPTPDPQIRLGE